MHTKELLERLSAIVTEVNFLYGELSEDLPPLRVVVDNTRSHSELKKMPRTA